MADWFCEGSAIESLPLDDRAIHYGDGLFETIAIRNGEARLWPLHSQRLSDGCQRLGIALPDAGRLQQTLLDAIASSAIDPGYAMAKIIVSAGSAVRGYRRAASSKPRVLIGIFSADRLTRSHYQDGVIAVSCETRIAEQAAFAGLKTLNRLEQVMARAEWSDASIFEGLMCDSGGRLICGTMSNVFIVRNENLQTPELRRCGVAGVMRRHVCELAAAAGVEVRVSDISWEDANAADEMFLSNSQFGILPLARIDDLELPTKGPGFLTRKLMDLLAQSGIEECGV